MKKSQEKKVSIKIVITKKLLVTLLSGVLLLLVGVYLFIMSAVNHRNPFNGLKYVPSNMVKIPISSSEDWKISKSDATKKLKKSGFNVDYIYNYHSSSDTGYKVGNCYIDELGSNKNIIQFYAKNESVYDAFPIKYGYDVKELTTYAPKGSTIILSVVTNDIYKDDEKQGIDY